jgi:hypothetical protein
MQIIYIIKQECAPQRYDIIHSRYRETKSREIKPLFRGSLAKKSLVGFYTAAISRTGAEMSIDCVHAVRQLRL